MRICICICSLSYTCIYIILALFLSLVQTDVISDCLNPMWMPWTNRAFVFNRMHSLSSIYIGVFNHKLGPMHHTGCGRVAIDLRKFEPNTSYTLKYELFSSPTITNRKVSNCHLHYRSDSVHVSLTAILSTFDRQKEVLPYACKYQMISQRRKNR